MSQFNNTHLDNTANPQLHRLQLNKDSALIVLCQDLIHTGHDKDGWSQKTPSSHNKRHLQEHSETEEIAKQVVRCNLQQFS
jgi:hypothetical protein